MKKGKIGFLFCLFFLSAMVLSGEAPRLFTLSSPSGSYRETLRLEVGPLSGGHSIRYRFKESRSDRFTNYIVPLVLSALQGEERTYTLHIQVVENSFIREEKELVYTIDKKAPAPPSASLSPDEKDGGRLRFSHPEDVKVYYSFEPDRPNPFTEWDGFAISLPKSGDYIGPLVAYAQDPAGNRSGLASWTAQSVDKPIRKPGTKLEISSPLRGRFLNPQLLVVSHEGYEWIRYTLGGGDPENGSEYTGPVEIPGEGDLILRLAAKEIGSRRIERRSVAFYQKKTDKTLKNGLIESETTLFLDSFGKDYAYCIEERSPGGYDASAVGELRLTPQIGAVRLVPLRIRGIKHPVEEEYRYFLTLNGKKPGEVFIDMETGSPILSGEPVLVLRGGSGAEIRYTLDGSDPGVHSPVYTGPRAVELPKESRGKLTIKARAFYSALRYGPVAEKTYPFKTKPPAPPVITRLGEDSPGYLAGLCTTEPGSFGVYEIGWGGAEPADPHGGSPRIEEYSIIRIPHGYANVGAIKFAAIDEAGNRTPYPETIRFSLNRLPPEEPQISVLEGTVHIRGEGKIYSRIIEEGIPGGMIDMRKFSPYLAPIALPIPAGKKTEYRIEAYTVDDYGNRSGGLSSYRFTLDRRIPRVPAAVAKASKAIIVNSDYTLDFSRRSRDLDLYYTFTIDGSEPPEPDTSSDRAGDKIVFQGTESQRIPYRVKVLSRFPGSPEQGQSAEFNFIIDKEPPRPPGISGLPASNIVNHGLEIGLETAEEEDELFFRIGKNGMADTGEWLRYEEPVRFEPIGGETVLYSLEYKVKDTAGNIYRSDKPLSFIIDQKPPLPPRLKNPPESFTMPSPYYLELDAEEGTIHYEISSDGTLPNIPEISSSVYKGPIRIGMKNNPVFSIIARTADEAGNLSGPLKLTDFLYDPFQSGWNPEPAVLIGKKGALLSWEDSGEVSLHVKSGLFPEGAKYSGPMYFPRQTDNERISYFRKDTSGNAGEARVLILEQPRVPGRPQIEGPVSGRYAARQSLNNRGPRGLLRYEMSADGSEPPEVTIFSPVLEPSFSFDSLSGETVHYRIHLKTFSEDGIYGSDTKELSYVIDRTPPAPPIIHGVLDNNYYAVDRIAELHANEGRIFYSIDETGGEYENKSDPPKKPESYKVYNAPLNFKAEEGTLASFHISAYALDEVGNRSLVVPSWTVIIDKAVVYVTRQGRDDFEGSRSNPVRSLKKAMAVLRSTKRSAIYLEKGTHVLGEPLGDFKSYKIIGGFDRETWRYGGSPSSILYQPEENEPFLRMAKNTLHIENLSVKDPILTNLNLIHMDAGRLTLKGCTFHVTGTVRGLYQDGGRLTLENTEFSSDFLDREELVLSRNSVFEAGNSRFSYEESGAAGSLIALHYARESSLDRVTLNAGAGLVSTAVHSLSSDLRITNTAITAGKGRLASLGIKCDEGSLRLNRVSISLPKDAYIATAVSLVNADFEMANSAVSISGNYGATGLYLKNARFHVTGSAFEGGESEDFLYYIHAEGTAGEFSNNSLKGGKSSDFIGSVLIDSSTEWTNNTMSLGIGKTTSMGFLLKGKSRTIFFGNSIEDNSRNGIIFNLQREGDGIRIENNRLKPGNAVLVSDNPSAGWSRSPTISTIRDIEALNGFSRPGGIFKDNYSWDQTGRTTSEE